MKKLRKTKQIYDQAITKENLYTVWNTVKKTCKNKKAVFYFSLNLSTNIDYIYYQLKNKTYTPEKYITFMIFEPKPRLVMSQKIYDKLVNHFVTNYYLIPNIEKSLIPSNVATRKEKGSKYAMKLIKEYFNKLLINNLNKEIYCLKIDISKYFYSIDHDILVSMLENKIKDKNVIDLIKKIISESNQEYINKSIKYYKEKYQISIPFYKENKGLSIGAMTSQFLAIFFLNNLDHFIKEKLKNRYYIRYMDDILILNTDKEKLLDDWQKIKYEIEKLKLNINSKSNIYKSSRGFSFLGYKYKIINNKLNIFYNKKTYYRIKRKLRKLYKHDKVKYYKSYSSYYGYLKIVKNIKEVDFKLKTVDRYNAYKEKYPCTLIIIKEGIFYKTFYDDAKIIWYLFNYKYVNDCVSFGNTPYDKVVDKLRKLDISFAIIDIDKEVIKVTSEDEVYCSYKLLANKSYIKQSKKEKLIAKFISIVEKGEDFYEEIDSFLDKYITD